MVVDFEFRADMWVFELPELGVLDDDEGVLAVQILDTATEHARAAEQAGVVDADHGHGLIGSAVQTHKCAA